MDYEKIYRELGILVKPMTKGYNPDVYAKELMQQYQMQVGVVYAASTTSYTEKNKEFNNRTEDNTPVWRKADHSGNAI